MACVDVDLHQLELRHDDLRIRGGDRRRRLIASVAELGQQVPVIVIAERDRLVLIDGYLRVEALRRLGRDQVAATSWPVTEPEALLHHRHLAASEHTAIEDAWLIARLRTHGLPFTFVDFTWRSRTRVTRLSSRLVARVGSRDQRREMRATSRSYAWCNARNSSASPP